jgi:serine/threonine protein kinase
MWAFACILLEMTGELPFKARSNTELTIQIISMLGNPSLQQIFEINPNYDLKEYEKLPKVKGKGKILHENQLLNDLLQKILVYSPERRLTAAEALQHEYFQEGRFPELRSDSPESPEVQRDIFATPFHKRDDSNLKTVASLEDETYRTNNSKAKSRVQLDSSRARKESLKMRLEKAGLSSKLVRKLPF